ncbi:hypothetical protein AB0M25_26125 [Streptomyces griseomycini]|uniref:hypothetical protein n=1 Tax=Streptomyces griseomycini TaxID=66895 RepID=UPI003415815E
MLRHAPPGSPRRPTVRLVAGVAAAAPAGTPVILGHRASALLGAGAPDPGPLHPPGGVPPTSNGEIEWP